MFIGEVRMEFKPQLDHEHSDYMGSDLRGTKIRATP